MTNCLPPSEEFDLARDLPTTAADVAALRRLKELPTPLDWTALAPVWPPPPDLRRRPTFAGCPPFELG